MNTDAGRASPSICLLTLVFLALPVFLLQTSRGNAEDGMLTSLYTHQPQTLKTGTFFSVAMGQLLKSGS